MTVNEQKLDEILHNISLRDGYIKVTGFPIDEEKLYILCPAGIGDTLFAAALVKGLKEYYKESRKVYLIVKENQQTIPGWFEAVDGSVVSGVLAYALDIYCIAMQTWRFENLIYGQFEKDFQGKLSYGLMETDPFSLYKKCVFNLPEEIPFEWPNITDDLGNDSYGIDKNAIILMPYAFSIALLPMAFWEILAEILGSQGYRVYTNVKDDTEQPVPGTELLTGDLGRVVNMCGKSRAVISLRSGICDVLAFTAATLFVIDTSEYYYRNWNVADLVNRERIFTFFYKKPEDGVEIIQKITSESYTGK